jgi:hypothetical protein
MSHNSDFFRLYNGYRKRGVVTNLKVLISAVS